jgi:hypothetical protein
MPWAEDIAPLRVLVDGGLLGDRHADRRRTVSGDQVVRSAAGILLPAGQGGDDLGRGILEEVDDQLVPPTAMPSTTCRAMSSTSRPNLCWKAASSTGSFSLGWPSRRTYTPS